MSRCEQWQIDLKNPAYVQDLKQRERIDQERIADRRPTLDAFAKDLHGS